MRHIFATLPGRGLTPAFWACPAKCRCKSGSSQPCRPSAGSWPIPKLRQLRTESPTRVTYARGRLAGRIERHERLARLPVLDELEAPEAAEPAHVTDRRMPLLHRAKLLREDAAHLRRVLDDPLVLERLDRRDRRSARERMPRVRQ